MNKTFYYGIVYGLVLVLSVVAHPVHAKTFTVDEPNDPAVDSSCDADDNPSATCSLREAITAANSDTLEDHVIIIPSGTITLALTNVSGDEDLNATGDLDITNTASTITITGAGSGSTIIDANGIDRIFEVRDNTTVTIEDLTIQGGDIQSGTGGGIQLLAANLTLNGVVVQNNTITSGTAGVGIGTGTTSSKELTIIDSTITGNNSSLVLVAGAGIFFNQTGTLDIQNSTISNNNLTHSTTADNGAGINMQSIDSFSLTNSIIDNNSTTASGGGIYAADVTDFSILNSTISNNTSGDDGGGIALVNYGTYTTIGNTTISDNTADNGAGLYVNTTGNTSSQLTLYASTLYANTAQNGGGIFYEDVANFMTLKQNAIGANIGSTSSPDCYMVDDLTGYATIESYNAIENTDGCGFDFDSTNNINEDVVFSSDGLADNGGSTQTVALQSTSPAINIVPPANCKAPDTSITISTDQRSENRTGYCDAGAYEYQDTTPPTFSGVSNAVKECGATFTDTATATDDIDGDLTDQIVYGGDTVNIDAAGVYTRTYNVSDLSLNAATEASRTITVTDTQDPVITLNGESTVNLTQGETYVDAGVEYSDSCDADPELAIDNPVDTDTPGIYTVTYTVSDASNNAAITTRTVTVAASDTSDNDDVACDTIASVERTDGDLQVDCQNGYSEVLQPFSGKKKFQYAVNNNGKNLVVTNGKIVKIYQGTTQQAQKKINNKVIQRLKYLQVYVGKIYKNKPFTTIIVAEKRQQQAVIYSLQYNSKLKRKDDVTIDLTEDEQAKKKGMFLNVKKKQKYVRVHIGEEPNTIYEYRITKKGLLKFN